MNTTAAPVNSASDNSTAGRSSTTVQSVDRALTILDILARDGEASLSAMAREVGVHKSTVGRLVGVLLSHGLVESGNDGAGYRLGVGCLRLAGATASRLDLAVEAQPVCNELSAQIGETTNVAITREGVAINVCQAEADTAVAMRNWIGQNTALHATSNGKVLMAHLPAVDCRALMDAQLERFTAQTFADPEGLAEELSRIRAHGWAYAIEEYEDGLNAVAAPVYDHSGVVIAGISVAGPSYRLPIDRLPQVREPVVRAAEVLSQRLGHRGAR